MAQPLCLGGAVLCLVTYSMDGNPPDSSVPGDSPGKNTSVCCHALFQGIFPTQRWNPGLPNCRWILYRLNHHRSPRMSMVWTCTLFDVFLDHPPLLHPFLENPARWWCALLPGNQTRGQRWNEENAEHNGLWSLLLRILARKNFQII